MKDKILTFLFGAYFFISGFFMVSIAAIICLVTAPFDPNRRILHHWGGIWAMMYIHSIPGWRVTYEGTENIDPHKTYVLVANHSSFWDIWVLYGLNKPYKWVSKESIFNVPNVGLNMYLNQYVKIKRGDLKSIKEMMATCKYWLKRGSSIMLFPEGTRSEDGEIQNFRDGAFRLAVDCDVPVVPIIVTGTHEIYPKNAKALNFRSDIKVRVLPPVYPADFERSSGLMRKHVHDLMSANHHEMNGKKQIGISAS